MNQIIGLKRHPREAFAEELAKLVSIALGNAGGWQVVANDLGQIAGGLVGSFSDHPQRDLDKLAAAIRNTNWRVAKRRLIAARMGIDPSEVDEKALDASGVKDGGEADRHVRIHGGSGDTADVGDAGHDADVAGEGAANETGPSVVP